MARNDALETGELTDTTFYILLSLLEARHGYLIMKNIEEVSDQSFKVGPASLYTSIKKLLHAELIAPVGDATGKKKTYIATKKGVELLQEDIKRREKMIRHAKSALNEGVAP
ncbi:PadR family transcriptional regulator [Thalassobacillus hwangdonensis]|uniref:PadR family transcriptional regulator n=1 Tax=Thalassobacillus hwangdonensis TaxID=546108 RepID=A0ABW3KXC4_9BACI